jgi:ERF superfamily
VVGGVSDEQLPAVQDAAPQTLLAAIVGMAKDQSVDVHKLQAVLEMQERLERRQAEREFIAAFARLSAKMPRVKKSGVINLGPGKGSIPFAKWEDMDKILRPLLAEEGFSLSFDSTMRPGDGGGLIVTGTLMHREGHSRAASMALPLDSGPGRNNLQAAGSSLAYGKRYTTEMLVNVVREGEDNDGASLISVDDAAELDAMMREMGVDPPKFLQQFFGDPDIRKLAAANVAPAKNMLLSKKKRGAS